MSIRCLDCQSVLPDGVNPSTHRCTFFRVDADYGSGFVLEGEAKDRTGYLILADRAWASGAVEVKIYRCVQLF